MKGYFNDAVETNNAIVDGWFHTGDAAVVHFDGYVEIRDRFKDVIISGGENISSVDVESVLLRHDAVQEVSVVGMPHPKWGEAAHALVVLRAPAKPPQKPKSCNLRVTILPTSKRRAGFRSCTICQRPLRAKYKNTYCAAAGRRFPNSSFLPSSHLARPVAVAIASWRDSKRRLRHRGLSRFCDRAWRVNVEAMSPYRREADMGMGSSTSKISQGAQKFKRTRSGNRPIPSAKQKTQRERWAAEFAELGRL
jgi:AMP-binding enzyme/AMP-binding enzyme C-terminal domain